jgi:ASC-1-like (ASCH) protein
LWPGESDIEMALNIYTSFPEYDVKEKNFGVIALGLKVAENQNEMTDDSNANLQ